MHKKHVVELVEFFPWAESTCAGHMDKFIAATASWIPYEEDQFDPTKLTCVMFDIVHEDMCHNFEMQVFWVMMMTSILKLSN